MAEKAKIKLKELAKIKAALDQICRMDLVGKSKWTLAKLLGKIEQEAKDYNKQKREIETKFGKYVYSENGKKYTVEFGEQFATVKDLDGKVAKLDRMNPEGVKWEQNSDEDYESYKRELTELGEAETEIEFTRVNVPDILIREGNQQTEAPLKPAVLADLFNFLTYEEPDK
jgi:hypothetical protein